MHFSNHLVSLHRNFVWLARVTSLQLSLPFDNLCTNTPCPLTVTAGSPRAVAVREADGEQVVLVAVAVADGEATVVAVSHRRRGRHVEVRHEMLRLAGIEDADGDLAGGRPQLTLLS